MTTIKFTDAAKYFKGEPQQIDALEYLEKNTSPEVKIEFEKRYRGSSPQTTSKPKAKIPQQALDLIKEFEGFVAKAYYDPLTKSLPITIGYGSTRRRDGTRFMIGNTVTQSEAEDLLAYQLETDYIPSLSKIPYWNEMNDEMKGSLLSFGYNLGANFFNSSGFNTISVVLNQKKWNEVPKTLELYRNPGSSVESGLLRRRIAEGKLWSKGLIQMRYK
jgi:GH24 family phage-related lysozyme (muramidase)